MTTQHNFQPYLDFAIDAAWQAGRLTLQYFQSSFPTSLDKYEVQWKGDNSPVTVADQGAEQLLRRLIEQKYPHHAIMGEEFGEKHHKASPEERGNATFRWIVDPIDGTPSFIRGVPTAILNSLSHGAVKNTDA